MEIERTEQMGHPRKSGIVSEGICGVLACPVRTLRIGISGD